MAETRFVFWHSDKYGVIRRRVVGTYSLHPEIWRNEKWVNGSVDVLDAVTGMGEDMYSCGETSDDLDEAQAQELARKLGVDLYAPGMPPTRRKS